MQQQQITKKQTYLRENIIEKGYDPESFVNFLYLKNNDADISKWTFQQLENLVSQFTAIQIQQKEIIASKIKIKEEQKTLTNGEAEAIIVKILEQEKQQKEQQIKNENKPQLKKNSSILQRVQYVNCQLKDKPIKKNIQAIPWKKFAHIQKPLQIIVQKPEVIVSGGFLGFGTTTTLWFTIKSNLSSKTVRRTDQDFDWLRNSLIKFYPGYIIPPLKPFSQLIFQNKKELNKRCLMINFFFGCLLKNQFLYNNRLVINFVSMNDQNFTKFRTEVQNTDSLKLINNLSSETGQIQIELTKQNRKKVNSLENHVTQCENIYKSLKEEILILMKNFDEISKTLFRISDKFSEIQESFSVLCTSVPQFVNSDFNNTLMLLNNIIAMWGKKNLNLKAEIDKRISGFFPYCQEQNQSIKELLKRRTDAQQQYLKFRISLNKKKQKIYPQISKWQTPINILSKLKDPYKIPKEEAMSYMLPKLTDQEIKLREWMAYINKCCQKEFANAIKIISKRYENSFKDLGKHLIEFSKNQLQLMERLSVGFD